MKLGDETVRARHWGPAHTGGDAAIHFEQANVVHLGDLLNNRGYPNVDAPAGASVHGWIQVLEKMAPAYLPTRSTSTDMPKRGIRSSARVPICSINAITSRRSSRWRGARGRKARRGTSSRRSRSCRGFEHFGGTKSRLGLALTIAYDELAKVG